MMMMMMKNMVMMMMMMMIICHQMGCVSGREVVVSKGEGERAMKLKIGSIGVLLVAGAVGVSLPLIGRKIPALRPENDIFFMVKAFAAGVILCTGFVHILPDAFESFNSPCLEGSAVQRFPFAGLVAMLSAIGTLMMDTLATGYYERQHFMKTKQVNVEEEDEEHAGHVHVHTHATHGHSHGSSSPALLRRRIVSQVLEVGIVVHSVIIGISLGTAQSVETIKPLMAALSFHQLFEGLGLGGCLSQAEFKWRSTVIMGTLFTVTAPVGIGVGIGVWKTTYNSEKEDSREAMLICGVFNAASSGILIYMALVDLLAADFMNPRLLSNLRLQLAANLSLLLGAASMSLLANWA